MSKLKLLKNATVFLLSLSLLLGNVGFTFANESKQEEIFSEEQGLDKLYSFDNEVGFNENDENEDELTPYERLVLGLDATDSNAMEELEDFDDMMLQAMSVSGFTPRTTYPGVVGVYYKTDNPFELYIYENGKFYYNYVIGGNCTWYAFGRAYEILGTKPDLSRGDAGQWWGFNKQKYDSGRGGYSYGWTPKLGAIACWSAPGNYGHVAIVENIDSNGVISLSESNIPGLSSRPRFSYNQDKVGLDSFFRSKGGGFQGYIYILPDVNPNMPSDSAAEIEDGNYYIKSMLGNTYVTARGDMENPGSGIFIQGKTESKHQLWTLKRQGDGTFAISLVNKLFYLDVYGAKNDNAGLISLWTWYSGANQRWYIVNNGDETYRFVAKHSGKVLDVAGANSADGTQVWQYEWTDNPAQKFKLIEKLTPPTESSPKLENGDYIIKTKLDCGRIVTSDETTPQNGNGAFIYDSINENGKNQVWNFEKLDDGSFKISSKTSGRVLEISEDTNLSQMWDYTGSNNQRWYAVHVGEDYYKFILKESGKCLDVYGAYQENGTKLWQCKYNGNPAQLFKLEKQVQAPQIFKVEFKMPNGDIINTQDIEINKSATNPQVPQLAGYEFTGWDKEFNNITANTVVTALFKKIESQVPQTFKVEFKMPNGDIISTQDVEINKSATTPQVPQLAGYEFTGWDKEFNNIIADTVVTALFKKIESQVPQTFKVEFKMPNGDIISTQDVEINKSATTPQVPQLAGYEFTGWDKEFNNIIADTVITAVFKKIESQTKPNTGGNSSGGGSTGGGGSTPRTNGGSGGGSTPRTSGGSGGGSTPRTSGGSGGGGGSTIKTGNSANTTQSFKSTVGSWIRDSVGWWFKKSNGTYPTSAWVQIGISPTWYYFDSRGYMVTGWNNIGGSWYYLEPSGAMATGWVITNGKWYYLASSGKMLTSTTTPDGYRVGHDGSWIR